MNVAFDHILWAVSDLDSGIALFEKLTGVTPVIGGAHPGFGTRNALSSLSQSDYIEVIAPDPAQDLTGTLGGEFAALSVPRLHSFAMSTTDLGAISERARAVGVTVEDPVEMSRTTPGGVRLNWAIMRLSDERWPGRLPFFIDWKGSPHPATTTSGGCILNNFTAIDPNAADLAEVFAAISCPVPVKGGACFGFIAELSGPNGEVILT